MKTPPRQADALLVRARCLLSDHRARAKKDGAALDYTLQDVLHLPRDNPLCAYCRMPVSFAASLDHRLPIARGGRHALGNLAACCARCNVEFPTKNGHEVKGYSDCSHSAGETYPSDE